jgi:hypothetical protein
MAKFTVEHTVSDQFIGDVLTTALESGSLYWAHVDNVCRVTSEGGDIEPLTVLSFQVTDAEYMDAMLDNQNMDGVEPEFPRTEVDFSTVVAGIRRILNGTVEVGPTIFSNVARAVSENDADLDSIDCDVIMQAGVMDRIPFG